MKHLSYFLALIAIGTFALLMVLEPVAVMLATPLVGALGLSTTSEDLKFVGYCAIAAVWALVLIVIWARARGLSPDILKPGGERRLMLGHMCLALGHVLLLSVLLVPALGYLMILPVIGVLLAYVAGIALIESARARPQLAERR